MTIQPSIAELARCLDCREALHGLDRCPACGRPHPRDAGILSAIGELQGRNRIAADFYDGQGWAKFRFWERLFLRLVGGAKKAREQILGFLPSTTHARILEIGIGDGENVPHLRSDAVIYGVDISKNQLAKCLETFPSLDGRLAWAEGENLPFPDETFDATFTIGGFNFFSDPRAALVEMRRVTRAGGPVIVADERPGLKNFGLGHLIGWKAFDAWWMRRVGLPAEFVEMVFATDLDLQELMRTTCPEARRVSIWKKLGYCLVHDAPSRRTPA